MKVYVIVKGYYSDYHICAVTLDKERAEGFRKLVSDHDREGYSWGQARIEEYDTDKYSEEANLAMNGYYPYTVLFNSNGHALFAEIHDDFYYTVKVFNTVTKYNSVGYKVEVMAKDEDHAIKIAQDIISEYRYHELVDETPKDI